MRNKYDPVDIPVLLPKGETREESYYILHKSVFVWCKEGQRMLTVEEVVDLFERLVS